MIEENPEELIVHMLMEFKNKYREQIDNMEQHFIEKFEEQLTENTKLRIENATLKMYKEMYLQIIYEIQGVGKNEEE